MEIPLNIRVKGFNKTNYLLKLIAIISLIVNFKIIIKLLIFIYVISLFEATRIYLKKPSLGLDLSIERSESFRLYEGSFINELAWSIEHLYIYLLYNIIKLKEIVSEKPKNKPLGFNYLVRIPYILAKRWIMWFILGLTPRIQRTVKTSFRTLFVEKNESLNVFLTDIIEGLFNIPRAQILVYTYKGKWYTNSLFELAVRKAKTLNLSAREVFNYKNPDTSLGFETFHYAIGPNVAGHYVSKSILQVEDHLAYITNFETARRVVPMYYGNKAVAECIPGTKVSSLLCKDLTRFSVPEPDNTLKIGRSAILEGVYHTGAEGVYSLKQNLQVMYAAQEDKFHVEALRYVKDGFAYEDIIIMQVGLASFRSFQDFELYYNSV